MKEKENILVISTKNAFSENLLKELEKRGKEASFIEKEELINNKRFDMLAFYKNCGGIILDMFTPHIYAQKDICDLSPEEWEKFKYISVKYARDLGEYVLKRAAKKGLNVLILTSVGGEVPIKNNMLVCAADASAMMFAKAAALELRGLDVNVNCFMLSFNDAGLGALLKNEDELLLHIPDHKIISAKEAAVAAANIYDAAKNKITGNVFKLDDAFSLGYMREY